ncbi:MAG: hypothetical protein ACLRFR_02515 [Clostridia bacterium]
MIVTQKLGNSLKTRITREKRRYRKQKDKVKRLIAKSCLKQLEQKFVIYFHEFGIDREILLKILRDLKEENEIQYSIGTLDRLEYVNIDLTPQFACLNEAQVSCASSSELRDKANPATPPDKNTEPV